jgi:hypothetical protein
LTTFIDQLYVALQVAEIGGEQGRGYFCFAHGFGLGIFVLNDGKGT